MDWLILVWAIIASMVYVGVYFLPASIGLYTFNFTAIYAIFFIVSVAACLLRARAEATGANPAPSASQPPGSDE